MIINKKPLTILIIFLIFSVVIISLNYDYEEEKIKQEIDQTSKPVNTPKQVKKEVAKKETIADEVFNLLSRGTMLDSPSEDIFNLVYELDPGADGSDVEKTEMFGKIYFKHTFVFSDKSEVEINIEDKDGIKIFSYINNLNK